MFQSKILLALILLLSSITIALAVDFDPVADIYAREPLARVSEAPPPADNQPVVAPAERRPTIPAVEKNPAPAGGILAEQKKTELTPKIPVVQILPQINQPQTQNMVSISQTNTISSFSYAAYLGNHQEKNQLKQLSATGPETIVWVIMSLLIAFAWHIYRQNKTHAYNV